MRVLVVLALWSLLGFGQHDAQNRAVGHEPVVIPLVLDQEKFRNVDSHLRVEYRAAPNTRVIAVEEAEKIWFFNDVPVLIFGSTGNPLSPQVSSRAMAWVRLFDGDDLVGEYPIHPRRDRVRIQPTRDGMVRALGQRLTNIDATYIAQVANYLVGNMATLDVTGSTYSVDSVGMVIDASGQWVGAPAGYWTQTAVTSGFWAAKDSNRSWDAVAMSADGTIQTAGVWGGQIYVSTDTGNSWTAKDSNRDWFGVAMSADGTIQTAGVWGGQIYVSTDTGNSWTAKDSNRDWFGVAMSADGTIQTASVRNGHIYVSMNTGDTWTEKTLMGAGPWNGVAMSADGMIQTAVVYGGQIYVSTDMFDTWTINEFPRSWRGVAMSADGTIKTAVVSDGQIYVSNPSIGVETAVGIGTLDPGAHLDVHGNAVIRGDLTITGSCTGCASDLALKDNIRELTGALDKITSLEGISFDWAAGTRDALYDPGRQLGVIAQDVEQVFPEIVGIDSRGYKYVDYQKLVVPLIEAVKQLQTQNECLQAQQEEFKGEIEALKTRSK